MTRRRGIGWWLSVSRGSLIRVWEDILARVTELERAFGADTNGKAQLDMNSHDPVTHAQLNDRLHHYVTEEALTRRLTHIAHRIRLVEQKQTTQGEQMSAISDMITALDTATNTIADELKVLRDKINAGEAVTAAEFQPVLDKLTALGADPANPIPA